MPKPPQYFFFNAELNKFKPFDYDEVFGKVMRKLTIAEVKNYL
jgi:hypothetical protein